MNKKDSNFSLVKNDADLTVQEVKSARLNNEEEISFAGVNLTFSAAIKLYLSGVNNPHTLRAKYIDLVQFCGFLEKKGFIKLGHLGAGANIQVTNICESFLDDCLNNGNSPVSVGRKKGTIRSFLKKLNQDYPELISFVPELKNSKYVASRTKGTTQALDKEEWWKIKNLLKKKKNPELYTMCIFALLAGGRRFGEVVLVVWSDINFIKNTVAVTPLKKKLGNTEKVLVPLNPGLKNVLIDYRDFLELKNKPCGKEDKLFSVSQPTVSRNFKVLARRAGIEKSISFHSLRASFITWSLENKDSMSEILNSSLHSSSAMIRYYDRTSNLKVSSINNLKGIV